MTIKEAIYYLHQKFNNRFRGIGSDFTTQTLSGTAATITATEDCWLCVVGHADSGITVAPCIDIILDNEVVTRGVGVTVSNTAVIASTYLKEGTVVTVEAYRCKLTRYNIFVGGGITLAIPMLSASERGCWRHEYQAGITHTSPRMEIPKTKVAHVRSYIRCCRKRNSRAWRAERFRSGRVHIHHDIPIRSARSEHERLQQQRSILGLRRDALRQDVPNSEQRQTAILRSCSKRLTVRGCAA